MLWFSARISKRRIVAQRAVLSGAGRSLSSFDGPFGAMGQESDGSPIKAILTDPIHAAAGLSIAHGDEADDGI
jgi:hypothetical protein